MKQQKKIEKKLRVEFKPVSDLECLEYLDRHHVRNPQGKPYPICSQSGTGRHCYSTGILSHLDPFMEGSNNELARFGPGVSLYFKWIKWSFWTMFIMAILALPMIFLNVNATGQVFSITNFVTNLDATTLGHLAVSGFIATDRNGTLNGTTVDRVVRHRLFRAPFHPVW